MNNKELYKKILANAGGSLEEDQNITNLDYLLNEKQDEKDWEDFHMDPDPNDPSRIVGKIKPGTKLRFKKSKIFDNWSGKVVTVIGDVAGFNIREPMSDHGGFDIQFEDGEVESCTMFFWPYLLEMVNESK